MRRELLAFGFYFLLAATGRAPLALAADSNNATMNGDVNCDGIVDLSDAIYLLSWKFLGGSEPCPFEAPQNLLARLEELEDTVEFLEEELYRVALHDWLILPMQGIRVADDDGTRAARITRQEAARWVEKANEIYAPARVHIEFDPAPDSGDWAEINNSLINGITGVEQPDWSTRMAAGNTVAARYPRKLVVFFRYGPDASPTGGGFSWTDYNFVAMPGFNDTGVCGHQNITLLAHEVGHYLGLHHTFAKEFDIIEEAMVAFLEAGFDPTIFDGDGLNDTRPDPFIRETQCSGAEGMTLSGRPVTFGRHNIMSYYDSATKTFSPDQIGILRQATAVRAGYDIRSLVEPRAAVVAEGEDIVAGAAGDGQFGPQRNMRAFHGKWTGDAQLFWNGALTGELTCSFGIPTSRRYRVYASFTYAPDFGIHEVQINSTPTDRTLDLYSKLVRPSGLTELGVFWLQRGANTITFRTMGKNDRSTAYALGLDFLLFQELDT